jgi:hypothetical protein
MSRPAQRAWYAGPVTGALLDLLDVGLLGITVFALVRRRRPAAVVIVGPDARRMARPTTAR